MPILKLAGLAVLMSLIWAAIWGLLYQFPLPFTGSRGGLFGLTAAPVAIAIYGVVFGGFIVPIIIALLSYWIMTRMEMQTSRARLWISSNIGAFLFAGGLATLHLVIGDW